MKCYSVKIYVSCPCEGERDAVVEINSPSASSVACYHISPDGALAQVPDVRLTTALEDVSRQVLQSLLLLEKPSLEWRSPARASEQRNRAA